MATQYEYDDELDIIKDAILDIMCDILQEPRETLKPRTKTGIDRIEGHRRLNRLLDSNSNDRIKATLRMNKTTFFSLRD